MDVEHLRLNSKILAILIGGAIGDALGWVTAEKPHISLYDKTGLDEITDFLRWKNIPGGRFYNRVEYIEKGEYSDDTQLTLSTARSINLDKSFDIFRFSKIELPFWLKYCRGAGLTTKTAARNLFYKENKWFNNFFENTSSKYSIPYREAGSNGAVMRIAPLAFINFNNFKKLKEDIWKNTITTHGHPRALFGALLLGFAITFLVNLNSINLEENIFLEFLIDKINSVELSNDDKIRIWIKNWNKDGKFDYKAKFDETKEEVINYIKLIQQLIILTDSEILEKLKCFERNYKRSGIHTTIAGICLFMKYKNDFKKALISTVNLINSDTDTIGSFVGQLVGAHLGLEEIPKSWREQVQDEKYIYILGNRLYNIIQNDVKSLESNTKEKNMNKEDDFYKDRIWNKLILNKIHEQSEIYSEVLGKGTIDKIVQLETHLKNRVFYSIRIKFEIGQSCYFMKSYTKEEIRNAGSLMKNSFLKSNLKDG